MDYERNLKLLFFVVVRIEVQNPKDMTRESGTHRYMPS